MELEVDISQSTVLCICREGEKTGLWCAMRKQTPSVNDKVVRICGRVEASRSKSGSRSRSSPGPGSDLGHGGDRS